MASTTDSSAPVQDLPPRAVSPELQYQASTVTVDESSADAKAANPPVLENKYLRLTPEPKTGDTSTSKYRFALVTEGNPGPSDKSKFLVLTPHPAVKSSSSLPGFEPFAVHSLASNNPDPVTASTPRPVILINEMENPSLTAPPPPPPSGFSYIVVPALRTDTVHSDKEMAKLCLVGGWASFMNMGRKGDAEKLRKMGIQVFGEEEFEKAMGGAMEMGM